MLRFELQLDQWCGTQWGRPLRRPRMEAIQAAIDGLAEGRNILRSVSRLWWPRDVELAHRQWVLDGPDSPRRQVNTEALVCALKRWGA